MATIKAREVAEAEVNKWLELKKVAERKRVDFAEQIENLIDAVMAGNLLFDDEGNIIQKLKNPIKGEDGKVTLDQLKYSPRVRMEDVRVQLATVKQNDTIGMVFAYMAAATKVQRGVLKEIMSDDFNTCSAIMGFFF